MLTKKQAQEYLTKIAEMSQELQEYALHTYGENSQVFMADDGSMHIMSNDCLDTNKRLTYIKMSAKKGHAFSVGAW